MIAKTLVLLCLLGLSAGTLTKTFAPGSHFFGTRSVASSFYNLTSSASNIENLNINAICYPGSYRTPIQFIQSNTAYAYCGAGFPNVGIIVDVDTTTTFTVNEYTLINSGRNAFTSGSTPVVVNFDISGFLYDAVSEYRQQFVITPSGNQNGVRFVGRDESEITVIVPPETTITPGPYTTPRLTNGQTTSVTRSEAWVCGTDASNFAAYTFTTSGATSNIFTAPTSNTVCQQFSGTVEVPNNVTFNLATPRQVTAANSPLSFNCSEVTYSKGGQLFVSYDAPPTLTPVQAIHFSDRSYSDVVSKTLALANTAGVQQVCQPLSTGIVNVTLIPAIPIDQTPAQLNDVIVRVANLTVPPRSLRLKALSTGAVSYYSFSSPNSVPLISAADSRGVIGGGIFLPNTQGLAGLSILNLDEEEQTIEVNATRFYFPGITSQTIALNSTVSTLGPLGVLPPSALCLNSTASREFTTLIAPVSAPGSLISAPNAMKFDTSDKTGTLVCRTGPSDTVYSGFNTGVEDEGTMNVVVTNGTALANNVTVAVPLDGTTHRLFTFPEPANGDVILVVRTAADFDTARGQGIAKTVGSGAFYPFVSTPGSNLNWLVLTPSADTDVSAEYLNLSPSCDATNQCFQSTCTNGVCGACTNGYSGYACSVAPQPSTSTSANQSQGGGSQTRSSSASSFVASAIVALVTLSIVF